MRNSLINFGSILASPRYFDLFNVPASFSQEVVDFLMNWWRLGISDASNLIFSPGHFSTEIQAFKVGAVLNKNVKCYER